MKKVFLALAAFFTCFCMNVVPANAVSSEAVLSAAVMPDTVLSAGLMPSAVFNTVDIGISEVRSRSSGLPSVAYVVVNIKGVAHNSHSTVGYSGHPRASPV
jgi:hypothetical protein